MFQWSTRTCISISLGDEDGARAAAAAERGRRTECCRWDRGVCHESRNSFVCVTDWTKLELGSDNRKSCSLCPCLDPAPPTIRAAVFLRRRKKREVDRTEDGLRVMDFYFGAIFDRGLYLECVDLKKSHPSEIPTRQELKHCFFLSFGKIKIFLVLVTDPKWSQ